MHLPVYFGTVLLERNRWAPPPRVPTVKVSEWLPRIATAGFDGIELWENHWRFADAAERQALRTSPVPVRVFNSYVAPETVTEDEIAGLRETLCALEPGVQAVKFNLRWKPAPIAPSADAAQHLANRLPASVHLWCECHSGTVVESPGWAVEAFARWPAGRFGAILHPFTEDDRTHDAWLHLLGPRIAHAHIQMVDATGARSTLGTRREFVAARLSSLLASGFTGSFTLEFTAGVGALDETPETLWANALADLITLREVLSGLG